MLCGTTPGGSGTRTGVGLNQPGVIAVVPLLDPMPSCP